LCPKVTAEGAQRIADALGTVLPTAEQLPATTTGLRSSTLARRLLASLRMRTEDIPEAAYWSVGAAACGGRDVFFELMNDMPVDLAELADAKAACNDM
jgi:hypothetical protein